MISAHSTSILDQSPPALRIGRRRCASEVRSEPARVSSSDPSCQKCKELHARVQEQRAYRKKLVEKKDDKIRNLMDHIDGYGKVMDQNAEMKQEVRKMQTRVNDLEAKNLRLATENFDLKVQMRDMENQHVMDRQADQDKIIELEQFIGYLQTLNTRLADAQ
ncbi:Protein CBG26210 [Caenorhabditis briggsae]|uniref:Protein CBG26210 n=1 Tax=Caenorhabditis briggsae TaxID=6238 RepID=B6ILV5_CAEBR|nr:Protein CBG26210 [Caenorhabditis briggsae]CAS00885.1 Protein CBG26210 [Caenorhabditis briggsae]